MESNVISSHATFEQLPLLPLTMIASYAGTDCFQFLRRTSNLGRELTDEVALQTWKEFKLELPVQLPENEAATLRGYQQLKKSMCSHLAKERVPFIIQNAFMNGSTGHIFHTIRAMNETALEYKQTENHDLYQLWGAIHEELQSKYKFEAKDLPKNAGEIRIWLTAHPQELASIVRLDLGNKGLGVLPKEIALLSGLKILNLNGNNLQEIPASIAALQHLESLSLNQNRMQQFPGAVTQLAQLKSLDISNNPMAALPANIGELQALERLYCMGMQNLQILPRELGNLQKLNSLELSGSHNIQAVPQEVVNIPGIRISGFQGVLPQAAQPVLPAPAYGKLAASLLAGVAMAAAVAAGFFAQMGAGAANFQNFA